MDSISVAPLEMPKVGFGTWRLDGDECRESVIDALAVGYRYIDTAYRYGNEEAVGDALRRSPVPREDVLLSTKLQRDIPGADVRNGIETSLRKLQTDYVDLLLMHWPNAGIPQDETLA